MITDADKKFYDGCIFDTCIICNYNRREKCQSITRSNETINKRRFCPMCRTHHTGPGEICEACKNDPKN